MIDIFINHNENVKVWKICVRITSMYIDSAHHVFYVSQIICTMIENENGF